ncbi:hypothetical protein ABIB25_000428 [Nakamurella sp. UYEF19]|uniref:hypothetical protein n=1 Tax=Nakamurella sp. UYEF19 TaxID=1756392 RepID=UPI0033975A36
MTQFVPRESDPRRPALALQRDGFARTADERVVTTSELQQSRTTIRPDGHPAVDPDCLVEPTGRRVATPPGTAVPARPLFAVGAGLRARRIATLH